MHGRDREECGVAPKQIASVDALSAARLVLGVGLGGRREDYAAAGIPTAGRGKRLEAMLDEMKRIWAGKRRGFAGRSGRRSVRDLRHRSWWAVLATPLRVVARAWVMVGSWARERRRT